jgi:hypothetical protein
MVCLPVCYNQNATVKKVSKIFLTGIRLYTFQGEDAIFDINNSGSYYWEVEGKICDLHCKKQRSH